MLGQLYVAGAAVPGVIADISHRVTPVTVKTQKEREVSHHNLVYSWNI